MNKTEFSNALAKELEVNQKEGATIVNVFLDLITNTLVSGEPVKLSGFANFEVRKTASRTAINPKKYKELLEQGVNKADAKSQSSVSVPAGFKPTFKPAESLKSAVNGQ